MSFRLSARAAQFPLQAIETVDRPGVAFDPGEAIPGFPMDASLLTTVHWRMKGDLGLPIAPFRIDLCGTPLARDRFSLTMDGEIELGATQADRFFVRELAELGCADALCICAKVQGAADTGIYALDVVGEEIPGSRVSADAGDGTAFVGPGIVGLRATGPVRISGIIVFGVRDDADLPFENVAEVAPALPEVAAYCFQSYLGVALMPDDALRVRLASDAFARANTRAPQARTLEDEVHREPPGTAAARVLASEPVRAVAAHYDDIQRDTGWSLERTDPSGLRLNVPVVNAMRLLATTGPVAAAALGHSVTIPVRPPFAPVGSRRALYEHVVSHGWLPFPLIRVRGSHRDPANGETDVTDAAFAGLAFEPERPGTALIARNPRPPQVRDGPASVDLWVQLDRGASGLCAFVDVSDGREAFSKDADGLPETLWCAAKANDHTGLGSPTVPAGRADLPLARLAATSVKVHCRDVFGRWPAATPAGCELEPWPVQAPRCGPAVADYATEARIGLDVDLSWDWATRTPFELRIGLALDPDGAVAPVDGIQLPDAPIVPLAVRFVGDRPVLSGGPTGWSISELEEDLTGNVASSGVPGSLDGYRRYRLHLDLGAAREIFSGSADVRAEVSADAWEAVGEQTEARRSRSASARIDLHDPRPPVLRGSRWRLEWASRADGRKLCHAYIDPAALLQEPAPRYAIWRAHESAFCDYAARTGPEDQAAADQLIGEIKAERDAHLRLSMIQGLIEPHLHKADYRRGLVDLFEVDDGLILSGPGEIAIPSVEVGLHFVTVTAMSASGVASDKLELTDLRAIAVPLERDRNPPVLRLIRPSSDSAAGIAGLVGAAIGSLVHFEREDVRFFWDGDGEVEDGSAILHRIDPVAEITLRQLTGYRRGVDTVLAALGLPFWRYFSVRPPASWSTHAFTADLRSARPRQPADEVASSRAAVQRLQLIPPRGPAIQVERDEVVPGGRSVTMSLRNVFEAVPAGLGSSMIQVSLLDVASRPVRSAPIRFDRFVTDGVRLVDSDGDVEVASVRGSGLLTLRSKGLAGRELRITVSDPAGRMDQIHLTL